MFLVSKNFIKIARYNKNKFIFLRRISGIWHASIWLWTLALLKNGGCFENSPWEGFSYLCYVSACVIFRHWKCFWTECPVFCSEGVAGEDTSCSIFHRILKTLFQWSCSLLESHGWAVLPPVTLPEEQVANPPYAEGSGLYCNHSFYLAERAHFISVTIGLVTFQTKARQHHFFVMSTYCAAGLISYFFYLLEYIQYEIGNGELKVLSQYNLSL